MINCLFQNSLCKKSLFLTYFNQHKQLLINNISKRFCENSKTKIMRIEIDENNNRKIVYEDFDDHVNKTLSSPPTYVKVKKQISKIKFFGSENLLVQESIQPTESPDTSSLTSDNNVTEEITDNLIKYDQFFSDYCRAYMKAGDGGNGLISYLKGPLFCDRTAQGGDGGKGGDLILIADDTVASLSKLRKAHFFGNNGEKGYIKSQGGKHGKDIEIRVPVGTIVNELIRDEDYKFKKKELRVDKGHVIKQIADMDEHGKRLVICKGGKPGIGNVTKKNINSENKALKGVIGEERELEFVMKCIADIGLIGYPNAGKSTLLAALTRAVPKIAPYPFTTLHPHLGKIRYNDTTFLTLADLPGLIEGAHANKGLGHKFLKHVERTKILLFILDGSLDPYEKRSPLNDLLSLFSEINLFNKDFSDKPFIVALNKCDTNEENYKTNLELIQNCDTLRGRHVISISGKEAIGLENLTSKIKELADVIIKIRENVIVKKDK